jgi:hypothetical protein
MTKFWFQMSLPARKIRRRMAGCATPVAALVAVSVLAISCGSAKHPGWCRRAVNRASRITRLTATSRSVSVSPGCTCSFLTATERCKRSSHPCQTVPMPPDAICLPSRYRPPMRASASATGTSSRRRQRASVVERPYPAGRFRPRHTGHAPAAPVCTCMYGYELRRKLRRPASKQACWRTVTTNCFRFLRGARQAGLRFVYVAGRRRLCRHRCTVTADPYT